MNLIPVSDIHIASNRQRQEMAPNSLIELSNSIGALGLIHPVVVRTEGDKTILVAGERRIRAIDLLWTLGDSYTHGGIPVPEGMVPATSIESMDPLDAMEMELEENIRRADLTWQERSETTSKIYELRRLQAEKRGESVPPSVSQVATQIYPDHHPNAAHESVRKELILSKHLNDPEVRAAKTADEGIKVIKRKEEAARQVSLGESVGKTFGQHSHRLFLGNCLDILKREPDSQFDCILTDPPYGINAQDFNDSGGKANAAGHTYDDSYLSWLELIKPVSHELFRLAKPQAHLYLFCDVDNFCELRGILQLAGWTTFRTPFVWHNPTSQRAPWPQTGPHRRWQMLVYAIKGSRPVLKLSPDLVTYASDQNLGWAAQKPVALYADLLARTCRAGDNVLDPFCGSGTIFPAAHSMKIKAMGVEMDSAAYGISVKRIHDLK
jgi:DNA modification methylase